jgi:hypothetical protein
VAKYARLDSTSDFVPFDAPDAVLVCPLLHLIVHVKVFPSGSLIGILQVRLNRFPVEPFVGDGVPNTGGLFIAVNMYHLRVYRPLPVGSVAFTHTLYIVEYANPDNDNDFVPFDAPDVVLVCPLLH